MTDLTLNEIALFAARHGIDPEVAYTLPTIFGNIALKAGKPVRVIIAQATYSNQALADYIKGVAEEIDTNG